MLEKLGGSSAGLKSKEKMVFYFFAALIVLGTFVTLVKINNHISVEVPMSGGKITEGVVGSPRFINPVLALSDTDRDLTSLIYSGLLRATPEGDLVNDLSEKYEISSDGLRYIFYIKEDAIFHDGTPVTADDVLLTISLAKNDLLKSPRRASWEGIEAEKIDEKTVVFHLAQPYAPFLENTTLGILPAHIWKDYKTEEIIFSDFNANPVGSGPYKFKSLTKDASGIPTSYTLTSFNDYILGRPYIDEIEIKFYENEELLIRAYNKREVDNIHAISPEKASELEQEGKKIITSPLPRVFGVFFNQNHSTLFTNKEVRLALNEVIPKERIIEEVLHQFGTVADSPLPPGISIRGARQRYTKNEDNVEQALQTLESNGWERGEDGIMIKETRKEDFRLSFSVSTSNAPELKAVANILKDEWSKIGAEVELKFFETGTLNQEVIRPRKYDALLFGEIVGRDLDLFAFWHSSQRNDPGLNIALYTNITADSLLEKMRATLNKREKGSNYLLFEKEISNDIPAIFLYSPDFIYVVNKNIKGLEVGIVTTPAERFLNVNEWHLRVDRVWPFFVN